MNTEPTVGHRSFSSFTSWLRCGKAWQLERGFQAPSEPAWWFVGGSAFHAAAEKYLLRQFDLSNGKINNEGIPF
jgi:putative RecB family exonuclease